MFDGSTGMYRIDLGERGSHFFLSQFNVRKYYMFRNYGLTRKLTHFRSVV